MCKIVQTGKILNIDSFFTAYSLKVVRVSVNTDIQQLMITYCTTLAPLNGDQAFFGFSFTLALLLIFEIHGQYTNV